MFATKSSYALKQFCAIWPDNQPDPVIGYTPGVSAAQIAECQRLTYLTPPRPVVPDMPGAIGIFPGETCDFILAKARHETARQVQFVFLTRQVLDQLSENIRCLEPFGMAPILTFTGDELPAFSLERPDPLDVDQLTEVLKLFAETCKANYKVVGTLLAALIQSMTIRVTGAPASLHERLTFVQGLLALLPVPIRHKATFTSNTNQPQATSTSIKFLAPSTAPGDGLVFDWQMAEVSQEVPWDSYTKFIISQLKLDESLVPEQVKKLSSPTLWEGAVGDTLYALERASRRTVLDTAIEQAVPIDKDLLIQALKWDASLTDELKAAYSQRLLMLLLALDEPKDAEILVRLSRNSTYIAGRLSQQLDHAAGGQHALEVFNLVRYWLKTLPEEPLDWTEALGRAALTHCTELVDGDPADLESFLIQLVAIPVIPEIKRDILEIVKTCRPLASQRLAIAQYLFALAENYLSQEERQELITYTLDQAFAVALTTLNVQEFQQITGNSSVIKQLPDPLQQFLLALTSVSDASTSSPALLLDASTVYGEHFRPLLLARLMELALYRHRGDLVDRQALQDLLANDPSQYAEEFGVVYTHAVETLEVLSRRKPRSAAAASQSVAADKVFHRSSWRRRLFVVLLVLLLVEALVAGLLMIILAVSH